MADALAFVDTETTGLAAGHHEIWEVALICDGEERTWQLPVDLKRADPDALRIGRFHERYDASALTPLWQFASEFLAFFPEMQRHLHANVYQTWKRHLVGAVPSFDDERLRLLLAPYRHLQSTEGWHYHLIDVEALAVGFLAGAGVVYTPLPWKSEDLSRAVGVEPDQFDRHTALGDARWAKAIYDAVIRSHSTDGD